MGNLARHTSTRNTEVPHPNDVSRNNIEGSSPSRSASHRACTCCGTTLPSNLGRHLRLAADPLYDPAPSRQHRARLTVDLPSQGGEVELLVRYRVHGPREYHAEHGGPHPVIDSIQVEDTCQPLFLAESELQVVEDALRQDGGEVPACLGDLAVELFFAGAGI